MGRTGILTIDYGLLWYSNNFFLSADLHKVTNLFFISCKYRCVYILQIDVTPLYPLPSNVGSTSRMEFSICECPLSQMECQIEHPTSNSMSLLRQLPLFLFSKNPYQTLDMATISAAKHQHSENL